MIELLSEVVNTDSSSYDHEGVDAVITRFAVTRKNAGPRRS
jgi:hypothetical protein